MANNYGFNKKTQQVAEKAAPKYDTQLFDSIENTKSVYMDYFGCDVYVVANVPHFKTNSKNGEYSVGFDTLDEAIEIIQNMAKLGVPGIFHIGKNLETGKFEVVKTYIKK